MAYVITQPCIGVYLGGAAAAAGNIARLALPLMRPGRAGTEEVTA